MNAWQRAALAALVSLVAAVAAADPYSGVPMRFERLSAEDGLAQNSVNVMVQDADGFLWFGTENGLNRYDGYTFLHFRSERSDPFSLPADYVTDLALAPDGGLWVATDGGGVARWNAVEADFEPITSAQGLSDDKVRRLAYDPRGYLWIGTLSHGLNRFDLDTGEITVFRHDPESEASLSNDAVHALWVDPDGTVWVGTNAGLNRVVADGTTVERVARGGEGKSDIAGDRVRAILRTRDDLLWIGTQRNGLSRSADNGQTFRHYRASEQLGAISNNRVEDLLEDRDGRLWVATANGLNRYLPSADGFDVQRYLETDSASLSDSNTISLHQDRGGLLWVGTKHAGLNKWNPRTWSFGHVVPEIPPEGNERVRHVTSFAEGHGGGIWFGSFGGGLIGLDADGKRRDWLHAGGPQGWRLDDDRVMALVGDEHALWVGTMTGGLSRIDLDAATVSTFRAQRDREGGLSADGIMSLFLDREGRLWIGTFGGGIDRLDPGATDFVNYPHDPDNERTLATPRVTAIAQDRGGRIWAGTDGGGLQRLVEPTGEWEAIRLDDQAASGAQSTTVYALHVDASGRLWVGTRDGLYRRDAPDATVDKLRFRRYNDRDGLPDDSVYGIRSDRDGKVWLSTNRGLSSLDPVTNEIRNYSLSHGLQGHEFNFGAHFQTADGRLWFGGPNGFNAFDPLRLGKASPAPRVALVGLELLNQPIREHGVYDAIRTLDLDYTDDVVTFEFAALDFAAPGENRFRYKLEGFDREWVEAGAQHRTTYTNLGGGDYTFRIRAANSDGVWSETDLALAIAMEPPPWLSTWAYAGYLLTALGALFSIWQMQERKLRQRAAYSRQLEQEVEIRTAELAARNDALQDANEKLHEASYTDPLTGLRNRRFFFEQIGAQLEARAARSPADRRADPDYFVFMMIDLDHFKPVNDTYGHQAGDRLLVGLAQSLEGLCRSTDTVIRWGGDEFMLVARRASVEEAGYLAERVRAAVASSVFPVGQGAMARTTSSIGYATYPFFDNNPAQLGWQQALKAADIVMYRAKSQRNSWCGVTGGVYSGSADALLAGMQADLDALHEAGELVLTEARRDASEMIA